MGRPTKKQQQITATVNKLGLLLEQCTDTVQAIKLAAEIRKLEKIANPGKVGRPKSIPVPYENTPYAKAARERRIARAQERQKAYADAKNASLPTPVVDYVPIPVVSSPAEIDLGDLPPSGHPPLPPAPVSVSPISPLTPTPKQPGIDFAAAGAKVVARMRGVRDGSCDYNTEVNENAQIERTFSVSTLQEPRELEGYWQEDVIYPAEGRYEKD